MESSSSAPGLRTLVPCPGLALLAALLLVPATTFAQQTEGTVYTTAVPASKGNTLYESATGDLSNGAGQYFFAGTTLQGSDNLRRGLLAFDLGTALPADASIDSVTLQLTMSMTLAGNTVVNLHRATSDWGEGTSLAGMGEGGGGPSTTGDATWIHTFFDTQFWTTAGGDFSATTSGGQTVGGSGTYVWGPTVEMVTDVQNWVDTPATNFGWVVVGDEAGAAPTAKRFNSRHNADVSTVPLLVVNFLSNSAIFLDGFESGDTSAWSSAVGGP